MSSCVPQDERSSKATARSREAQGPMHQPVLFNGLRIQLLISCFLVLVGFYAMTFTPYDGIYGSGVWGTDFSLDPRYGIRAALITTGLVGGALSVFTLLLAISVKLIRRDLRAGDLPLQAAMSLVSLCVGWLMFPYWVNGVFQAFAGNREVLTRMPILDFDPKALMPESWFGDSWWLVAFPMFYLISFGLPFLLLADVCYAFLTRNWRQAAFIACCLFLTGALVYLSPGFGGWLVD